jgi:hypothetical protein
MNIVNLIEVYKRLSQTKRTIKGLQVVCVLGEQRKREAQGWLTVPGIIEAMEQEETNSNNVYEVLRGLASQELIERRNIDRNGEIVDTPTRHTEYRMTDDCFSAFQG